MRLHNLPILQIRKPLVGHLAGGGAKADVHRGSASAAWPLPPDAPAPCFLGWPLPLLLLTSPSWGCLCSLALLGRGGGKVFP